MVSASAPEHLNAVRLKDETPVSLVTEAFYCATKYRVITIGGIVEISDNPLGASDMRG
jgi:hypothetical protein